MTDRRQLSGTAFALRDPFAWSELADLVRGGESLGYRAVFLPEIAGRDAFATLTGLAPETDELLLGSGVAPITSRSAHLTAMAAGTVHERSAGRAIVGLGTGAPRPGALAALAEQIRRIRAFTAPGGGSSLSLPSPLPIWIAALGPRAVRLAAELADGVILNWCTPERVARARAAIADAATEAGRDPGAITISVYVRASPAADGRAALREAAGEYASYPGYARQFAAMGLGEAAEAAAAARADGRPDDVPDELVDAVCLPADAPAAAARLQEFRDAGADLPVVYPVIAWSGPQGVRTVLRALAPRP